MFRRFSRSPETGTSTLEQRHAAVRRAAVDALARRGITVTPAPEDAPGDDWFVGSDGMQYRLYNLQLQCAQLPAQDWPRAVEGHFDRLLAGRTAARPADLGDAELLAQIRTRLNPPEVGAMVSMSYARPAFGGLLAGLSRDLPTTVQTVGDQDVAGRDLDLLYQAGQRNTDAEPMSLQRLDHGVVAVTGESYFIASKALNIPALIRHRARRCATPIP